MLWLGLFYGQSLPIWVPLLFTREVFFMNKSDERITLNMS